MNRSTALRCVYSVLNALFSCFADMFINAYRDSDRTSNIAIEFEKRFGVPGVIGVIDGSHIPIMKYSHRRDACSFINRKGWKSIILQAVVDAAGRFINIDVGEKGSRHDAFVFHSSDIGAWLETNEAEECIIKGKQYLLGDGAYRLKWYMMKAFDKRSKIPAQFDGCWKSINRALSSKKYV